MFSKKSARKKIGRKMTFRQKVALGLAGVAASIPIFSSFAKPVRAGEVKIDFSAKKDPAMKKKFIGARKVTEKDWNLFLKLVGKENFENLFYLEREAKVLSQMPKSSDRISRKNQIRIQVLDAIAYRRQMFRKFKPDIKEDSVLFSLLKSYVERLSSVLN